MATKSEKKRAQALIDLEYGPQLAQVRNLWGRTRTDYLNALANARQTERAIKADVAASEPKIQSIYDTAGKDLKASNSFVDQAIAATNPEQAEPGSLSALLTQSMQRERGAARNANTAARARDLTELTQRASGATAGKALAYRSAKNTLNAQRKDLTQQLSDLTGQSSAKMTALLEDMKAQRSEANAKTRQENAKANQRLTSGPYRGHTQAEIDAATPEQLRKWEQQNSSSGGGGGKGKKNRATNDQRLQLSDAFNEAFNTAKSYAASDKSARNRHAAAAEMMKGAAPAKGGDPNSGVHKSAQFATSLALDMAFDGHISRANAKRLHDLGYKVSDLTNALSYQQWLKTPAGKAYLAREAQKQTALHDRNAGPRG